MSEEANPHAGQTEMAIEKSEHAIPHRRGPLMGNKKSQVERKTRAIIFNKCAQGRAIFICVYMDGISLVVVGG